MKTALLVDDEQRMLDLLSLYISPHNYRCIKCASGMEAIEYLKKESADVVILDVMMPEMDGWETCEKIREFSNVPIIMLTARNDKNDIVKGLRIGADDYVTKPFNEEELLARIEAVIRRYENQNKNKVAFKGLIWDHNSFELKYEGISIKVTPKEFALIGLFLRNPNKVFTREHLLSSVWGQLAETEDRTIDSHIRNIREKLRKAGFPIDEHLLTVWGIGYKWRVDDNK
ncbi:two-component response regulator [Bacillus methanolicus PB1]|uniref:Two-component response regulator n=1 Tax=Bacillus methanolicus PB1 TaxID=997296 RepID=I3DVV4_BACMT|nr:response regulator transcription factor [Bacillus methanolicus]EIJ78375.1 two-component response regulator [Bacillus methanolicus PB1]